MSRRMKNATYVGHDERLIGARAIVRECEPYMLDFVEVQLNDLTHPYSGGWHLYARFLWKVDFVGCEVCGIAEAVAVVSVPGVPMSCAYCEGCLLANAHPWSVLVNMTACTGQGYLDGCSEEWVAMVEDTITHLGETKERFFSDVAECLKALDEYDPNKFPCEPEECKGHVSDPLGDPKVCMWCGTTAEDMRPFDGEF